MHKFLEQDDFADLAVVDLQARREWQTTALVLSLWHKKTSTPITKRCVIRYALVCPNPEAARFIEMARRSDPETVRDCEEFLAMERKAGSPSRP